MNYDIDGKKLKEILVFERGLALKPVSRRCGVHADYLHKAVKNNRLSNEVVKTLHDKYEINPARYVPGWKGDQSE